MPAFPSRGCLGEMLPDPPNLQGQPPPAFTVAEAEAVAADAPPFHSALPFRLPSAFALA